MTAHIADWLIHQGLKHAFHPAENGERAAWCGLIAAVADLRPIPDPSPTEPSVTQRPAVQFCTVCVMAHGTVMADHHGANVHRAKDPENLRCAPSEDTGG